MILNCDRYKELKVSNIEKKEREKTWENAAVSCEKMELFWIARENNEIQLMNIQDKSVAQNTELMTYK